MFPFHTQVCVHAMYVGGVHKYWYGATVIPDSQISLMDIQFMFIQFIFYCFISQLSKRVCIFLYYNTSRYFKFYNIELTIL
jgi:hypothetical protein